MTEHIHIRPSKDKFISVQRMPALPPISDRERDAAARIYFRFLSDVKQSPSGLSGWRHLLLLATKEFGGQQVERWHQDAREGSDYCELLRERIARERCRRMGWQLP